MKALTRILATATLVLLSACGGGGGGGSSACGTLKVNGGESCNEGAAPVVLVSAQDGDNELDCTGTVISQTAILTAAHCVYGRPSMVTVANSEFYRRASSYIVHPLYRPSALGFDLAIIKVADPMPVAPVPLLVSTGAPNPGSEVVAYGYGVDEQGRSFKERLDAGDAALKATFLTFSNATNGYFYETVTDGAGQLCKGDSGGPILARNNSGDWGIIAVTSFSSELSETVLCVPINPGAIAVVSPTQSDLGMAFILKNVPDAELN